MVSLTRCMSILSNLTMYIRTHRTKKHAPTFKVGHAPVSIRSIVVGMKFRNDQAISYYSSSTLPILVDLEPEPNNPHDPAAIKVMLDDFHIGYIPKSQTSKIHKKYAKLKYVYLTPGPDPLLPLVKIVCDED